jgi:hypothetical protein
MIRSDLIDRACQETGAKPEVVRQVASIYWPSDDAEWPFHAGHLYFLKGMVRLQMKAHVRLLASRMKGEK